MFPYWKWLFPHGGHPVNGCHCVIFTLVPISSNLIRPMENAVKYNLLEYVSSSDNVFRCFLWLGFIFYKLGISTSIAPVYGGLCYWKQIVRKEKNWHNQLRKAFSTGQNLLKKILRKDKYRHSQLRKICW